MQKLFPIGASHAGTILFGVLGIGLLTRWAPQEIYAPYALFLTLTQLGYMLTHSGLINHATRYWQREQSRSGAYARFLWNASGRNGLYLALVLPFFCVGLAWNYATTFWLWMLPVLWFGNLVVAIQQLALVSLNAGGRLWKMCALNTVINAARGTLPALSILVFGASVAALNGGYIVHGVIALAAVAAVFHRSLRTPPASPDTIQHWRRELRVFGRPFILMGVGGWLLLNADRWIIAIVFGDIRAADFYMAGNIGRMATDLTAMGMLQLFFPAIFRRADAAKTANDWRSIGRECDRHTLALFTIALAGLGALWLIGPWLKGTLVGENYEASLGLIIPAGCSALTVQINQFQYLLLQGQHNSAGMVKALLTLATLKVVGSVVAAAISWEAFLVWTVASLAGAAMLGRGLVRAIAFREFRNAPADSP